MRGYPHFNDAPHTRPVVSSGGLPGFRWAWLFSRLRLRLH